MKKSLLLGMLTLLALGAWAGEKPSAAKSKAQLVAVSAQSGQQNPDTYKRGKESAQEKASGIADSVDIVSGPNVENVTKNSAWLTWTTNKNAATRVRYGTDQANPSQHAYVPGGSTQHRVELKNLRAGTKYHYEIETRVGKDRFKGSFDTPQ